MPQFPRPEIKVKPLEKEGLPPREGDYTFNILSPDQVETRMLYSLKNYHFIDTQKIDFNKNFAELGLDSLEVIQTITSIEQEFNFIFPDNEFDNFSSFKEIAEVLYSTPEVI